MLNKANFLVTEFVSKEQSRYSLTAIQVRPEATVATNGCYLAWVSTDQQMKPDNVPAVEGFAGGQSEFKPFLLDVESAKQISKAIPKKSTIPVLQYAAVHVNGVGVTDTTTGETKTDQTKGVASVQVCTTDLERPQVFRPRVSEGQFPNYQAVIPDWEKDVAFEIAVDARYLATIAKAFSQFIPETGKGEKCLRVKFYKPEVIENTGKLAPGESKTKTYDKPIRFDATNGSQGMTVVLMPMRSEGDIFGTYGYKEREAARETARKAKTDVCLCGAPMKDGVCSVPGCVASNK